MKYFNLNYFEYLQKLKLNLQNGVLKSYNYAMFQYYYLHKDPFPRKANLL